ncbi:Acyl-CoA:lysophosphatidylglycerol acyltransferase 1 [Halotydeus destructor]|nr:Acyl-CoA:lysophosphatidylglycerol acyltransferase 1 [Halotydeus destructor]
MAEGKNTVNSSVVNMSNVEAVGEERRPPDGKLFTVGRTIYGFFRLLCILCHNIYHAIGFFVVMWIVLLPLYYIKKSWYRKIENHLYTWCLYTVGSWSWLAGIKVIECGDDIRNLLDKQGDSSGDQVNKNAANNNRLLNESEAHSPSRSRGPNQPSATDANGELIVSNEAKVTINGNYEDSKSKDSCVRITSGDERKGRVMLLSNHQSMGDVPLMFQAFVSHTNYIMLWVMDNQFKFTHFGMVSAAHGDYFIKPRDFKKTELTKHCQNQAEKDFVVLFPEGGFRYKRTESSNKYAAKNGWPVLKHLTWPRAGAFYDLADESVGITHVVDMSVLYANQDAPISIGDIIFGLRPGPVFFHYRVFERSPDIPLDEKWLNERWLEKEQLMHEFYTDKEHFLAKNSNSMRPIELSWLKMISIHVFYLAVCYWLYFMVRLGIWYYNQPGK